MYALPRGKSVCGKNLPSGPPKSSLTLVSCVRQLHYLIKVEFHCLLSLSTTTNMSSTQLPPLDQREMEFLKKVMEGTPTEGNESRDYAETLLWKDEKEFQEVLDYWS